MHKFIQLGEVIHAQEKDQTVSCTGASPDGQGEQVLPEQLRQLFCYDEEPHAAVPGQRMTTRLCPCPHPKCQGAIAEAIKSLGV